MIVIEMNLKWINCIWGIVIEVSLLCSLCLGVDTLIISSNFYLSRGVGLMSVLSTNHRDHSLSYEHELFSISSKKIFDWTERLHDKWHFCYVVVSGSSLQTKSDYISIWTSILIKCSVCCMRFIWVICLRLTVLHGENDLSVVYVELKSGKQLMFFVSDSKLESHFEIRNSLMFRQRVRVSCKT